MRKVEMQMNTAIRNRVNWSGGNTTVMIDPENADQATVYLHGNRIAQVCSEFVAIFDGGWQSVTTKSRLNTSSHRASRGHLNFHTRLNAHYPIHPNPFYYYA